MSLPKISLILFSFNQEKTILEAAHSCLSQDYRGELDILFSDDSSTDTTFEIIQALKDGYQGNRHITIHKNKNNPNPC